MAPAVRRPFWSETLTVPLAERIPIGWRPAVLHLIKAAHTAIFFSVAGLIVLFAVDGVRQRPGRRSAIAAGIALAESAVYASNNQVCPLTPLAEELGASSGQVADIFLPSWFSRRIPVLGVGLLLVGLAFNSRAWLASGRHA